MLTVNTSKMLWILFASLLLMNVVHCSPIHAKECSMVNGICKGECPTAQQCMPNKSSKNDCECRKPTVWGLMIYRNAFFKA